MINDRNMYAAAAVLALAASAAINSTASAEIYYWDNNGSTSGFGTAGGTWAAPTTGDSTQGWSTSSTGSTLPAGVTTTTADAINFGTATAALGAGTINVSGSVSSGNMTFGAANSGELAFSGGTITFAASSTLVVATGGTATIGSTVAGATTTLSKNGSGAVKLTNTANTYTGGTSVLQGSIEVKSIENFGTASSLGATASGTHIQLGNGNAQGTLIYTGAGNTSNRTFAIGSNTASNFGGARIFANNGTGILTFTASTFNASRGSANMDRVFRLSGTGVAAINGKIQNNSSNSVNSLLHDATGTWRLGGANTYTGTTTVDAGTLLINGDSSLATGAVAVNNSAVLGGKGTIGGAVSVNGTAKLAPGDGLGKLTVKALTLGATSATLMELGGTTPGTDQDNLTVSINGALNYGGDLKIFDFAAYDLTAANATYDLFAFGETTPLAGSFASVMVNDTLLTNNGSGLWTGGSGGVSYSFAQGTGDLAVVVPEPMTFSALASVGALGLLSRRRRNFVKRSTK